MIREVKQNILHNIDPNQPTVIIHGCNCYQTMGAGVAKSLRDAYPQVYEADKAYNPKFRIDKLGHHTLAKINKNLYVFNCYTQYRYGRKGLYADYKAIDDCLKHIGENLSPLYKIRISRIGCNNAGGDWKIVKKIIEKRLKDFDVTVCYL